jgi:hypothetical protein
MMKLDQRARLVLAHDIGAWFLHVTGPVYGENPWESEPSAWVMSDVVSVFRAIDNVSDEVLCKVWLASVGESIRGEVAYGGTRLADVWDAGEWENQSVSPAVWQLLSVVRGEPVLYELPGRVGGL